MLHLTENDPRLYDYMDGCLPAPERAAIEQHLACCPECAALCRQYQQLDGQLARAFDGPSLSSGFHASLLRQVDLQPRFAAKPLPPEERQKLESQFNTQWQKQRRRFFREQLPRFLDFLGYSAAAAVGGSVLFRMIIALLQPSGAATNNISPHLALALGVGAGAVILLTGFAVLAKSHLTRWLAYF